MRVLDAGDFAGRVTFVTGPARASGKTSLLNAGLNLLRRAGEKPAFLGIGFDGERRAAMRTGGEGEKSLETGRFGSPRIWVETGELFVSSARWLETSRLKPEILALLPGSSALGRLALARAGREGEVVLVGPDSNETAAEAVRLARVEGGAGSVLVDGAFSRLTQVAELEDARFFSSMRIDPQGLEFSLARMRLLAALARLPRHVGEVGLCEHDGTRIVDPRAGGDSEASGEAIAHIQGPLTAARARDLPVAAKIVVVDDFTKVFLEEGEFLSLARSRELRVRRTIEFGGFVLVLHGIELDVLLSALGKDFPEELLIRNPYEEGGVRHVA